MPEHGFACPLVAQIDDELRTTYPAIIGHHPLLRWWGFKYDSRLNGINVHADFAAVNVNFWITPDEANLDPAHGGLVVWDKPAPLEWTFAQYNSPGAGQAIREFLANSGAQLGDGALSRQSGGDFRFRSLPRDRPDRLQGRLSQPPHQHHDALRHARTGGEARLNAANCRDL